MPNKYDLPELSTNDTPTDFAVRLRMRVFASQREAAEALSVQPSTINRYEGEGIKPPPGYLAHLMRLIVEREAARGLSPAEISERQAFFLLQGKKFFRRFGAEYKYREPFRTWEQLCRAADSYLTDRSGRQVETIPAKGPAQPQEDHDTGQRDKASEDTEVAQMLAAASITAPRVRGALSSARIAGILLVSAIGLAILVVPLLPKLRTFIEPAVSVQTASIQDIPTPIQGLDDASDGNSAAKSRVDDKDALDILWLDAWRPHSEVSGYWVRGMKPVPAGRSALMVIEGTYSAWSASWWKSVCKGTPDPAPRFPSEGLMGERKMGMVGLDMEYAFAAPSSSGYCGRQDAPPYVSLTQIEMSRDEGRTWEDPTPLSAGYSASHVYRYQIMGLGAPLEFRVKDHDPQDNYGRLKVVVILEPQPSPSP
ncbi:MAG TPA: helix-turn-helix transcriptional regulator [Chloroflexia bacterium]|nr:helix-turn-helix transcriptional regulator [Chloroflexia bacterium]